MTHSSKVKYNANTNKKKNTSLPEGIHTEAQLWDEIFKSMVFFMPNQLFPLIKELFQTEYPKGSTIELIQTEYTILDSKKNLKTIRTDITFRVHTPDSKISPIYHLECQTKNDGLMSIRMFEYDVHIALSQTTCSSIPMKETNIQHISFPTSAVIYLQHTKNTPDHQICQLDFPDGQSLQYKIPVLKVQLYSLEEIHKKHLNILIPFLPLRFRNRLNQNSSKTELTMEELTAFFQQVILIIQEETLNHLLSQYEATRIMELLNKSIHQVFRKHEDYRKEALKMTTPILTFEIDKWMELAEQRLTENQQLSTEKEQIRTEKEQIQIIAKLALQGFRPEEIAKRLNLPLSYILELGKD